MRNARSKDGLLAKSIEVLTRTFVDGDRHVAHTCDCEQPIVGRHDGNHMEPVALTAVWTAFAERNTLYFELDFPLRFPSEHPLVRSSPFSSSFPIFAPETLLLVLFASTLTPS